ncbi:MAG: YdcF family protein [Thiobacillaceae bacterium]|nr:YdcF family protein [Thiobacillaceae bacterium]MDW8323470.1 YdcF family protein [Burkholderiales bacterium]
MDIGWLITQLLAAPLLPPLNVLLLAAAGWWLTRSRRRQGLGRALMLAAVLLLWGLSTPYVADWLLDRLKPPRAPIARDGAQAIVILAGGAYRDSLEYAGDTVGRLTLERLRYGARIARDTGLPVLVTGGDPEGGVPEARLMRAVLETEFGVPVRWVEERSHNTRENARYAAQLLKKEGIERIYLVSHAWHLARAMPEFERAGLSVLPAGLGYSRPGPPDVLDFVPSARALLDSHYALHEALGLIWYRIRNLL